MEQPMLGRCGSGTGSPASTWAMAAPSCLDWCYGFYNHDRRHSAAGMMSPINYENTAAPTREAA
jgi:hypothetical protein